MEENNDYDLILKFLADKKSNIIQLDLYKLPTIEGLESLTKERYITILDKLEIDGIIKELLKTKSREKNIEIMDSGKEFIRNGGYRQQYLDNKLAIEKKENLERKDEEIKDLTIKDLKLNIFQLKYWWVLLIINMAVGIITALLVYWITKSQ